MFSVDKLNSIVTPYYYYDTQLLRKTLEVIKQECEKHENFHVHYAVKANANPKILRIISQYGFGADCVSGGEIKAAIEAGFPADKVVYAGVGKSDWEIRTGEGHCLFQCRIDCRTGGYRRVGSGSQQDC